MLKNTRSCYGAISRSIHWLTALMVVTLLLVGFFMVDLKGDTKAFVYMLHKSFGLLVLFLSILRLLWHVWVGIPSLPTSMSSAYQWLARSGHAWLYFMLLFMPLSGWIMSMASEHYPTFFGWFIVCLPGVPVKKTLATQALNAHQVLAWIFIAAILIHVLAALRHYFICRDGVFERMAFGQSLIEE